MAGHTTQLDAKTLWGGKESPFQTSYGKLMMWFFLVSDALTFSGLLIAYGFTRHDAQDAWPIGEETFNSMPFLGHGYPLLYVALMTFILIVSSVTMVLAVEAGHRMDKKGVVKWLGLTIIGGFFFLGSQAWEWSHFIHGTDNGSLLTYVNGLGQNVTETVFGANLMVNEYGPASFAQLFFFITGFHGFHVTIGVFLLFLCFYQAAVGIYDKRGHYEMVEKVGLYWHFVDLVWVFVFLCFYLI